MTGATGGLGSFVSLYFTSLALSDSRLFPVFCCRNRVKADALRSKVEAAGLRKEGYAVLLADLAQKGGVETLVRAIKRLDGPLRYLVNNAASMFSCRQLNEEGMEMNMAVNFYASARCAEFLAPVMVPGASVVNILSLTRNWVALKPGWTGGSQKGYSRLGCYSRSKLALSVFTADMAERYSGLCVNGVDPGVMDTSMLKMDRWFDPLTDCLFRPFARKPGQALPAVVRACENRDRVSGHIFTRQRHFPIEKATANHPFRMEIRDLILSSVNRKI